MRVRLEYPNRTNITVIQSKRSRAAIPHAHLLLPSSMKSNLVLALVLVFPLAARAQSLDALADAIKRDDSARVAATLQQNSKLLDSTNEDGWTPLHVVAYGGKIHAANALIARHAKIDAE